MNLSEKSRRLLDFWRGLGKGAIPRCPGKVFMAKKEIGDDLAIEALLEDGVPRIASVGRNVARIIGDDIIGRPSHALYDPRVHPQAHDVIAQQFESPVVIHTRWTGALSRGSDAPAQIELLKLPFHPAAGNGLAYVTCVAVEATAPGVEIDHRGPVPAGCLLSRGFYDPLTLKEIVTPLTVALPSSVA